ncbi:hypothetical protein DFA_07794 [Cavenderia fasciculata]|uniref:Carbohydrate binding domain-containing protein n=1 Tax=Cavenderia fasciculata TaxID=261658 RepID=F4Q3E7_CACFS|nr:uncharacterized protein DFA_07794 [Cavenderia fasciculata]EGG16816.1 hypothetical protein DFA_07794 [Cavenderia fasciculata]|eukprot:XP_004355290.1 hypothetical protein DFA_07794 [Cavenderia fasciculata]
MFSKLSYLLPLIALALVIAPTTAQYVPNFEVDWTEAYNNLVMSYLAYCPDAVGSQWDCPGIVCSNQLSNGFFEDPSFTYLSSNTVDNVLFYFVVQNDMKYLIFRGTDDWTNIFTDLDYKQTGFGNVSGSMVATGFFTAWETMQTEVERMVFQQGGCVQNEHCNLTVTGHSLGGAIATLASWSLQTIYPSLNISVQTFGSPMVGNLEFVDMWNAVFPVQSRRFVYYQDGIPTLYGAIKRIQDKYPYYGVNNEVYISTTEQMTSTYNPPPFTECDLSNIEDCQASVPDYWYDLIQSECLFYYHRQYFGLYTKSICTGMATPAPPLPGYCQIGFLDPQHPTLELEITSHWMAGGFNYTNVVGTITNHSPVAVHNPVFTSTPNIQPVSMWKLAPSTVNGIIHWRLAPNVGDKPVIPAGSQYIFAFTNNATTSYTFTRIK